MTDLAPAERALHARLINAAIACLSINVRENYLPTDIPNYAPIGFEKPPKCLVGGDRGINAGFVGVTEDGYALIAFRGTISSADTSDSLAVCLDWTQDRLYEPVPWTVDSGGNYGSTCKGFTVAMTSVRDKLKGALADLDLPSKAGVLITGHSKGGAMARLAASVVRDLYPQDHLLPQIVTFGAPMVGNQAFKDHYIKAGLEARTIRYQNQYDAVPTAPTFATPPLPMEGCYAVQVTTPAQKGYEHVGTLRYIYRDATDASLKIMSGFGTETAYTTSVGVAASHTELIGPAHDPRGNYYNVLQAAP